MVKKVLIVTDSLAQGGAERQMALLACNMPSPWESSVWSLHDGFFSRSLTNAGVQVEVPNRSPLRSFRQYVRKIQPDIIHYWGNASLFMTYPFVCASGIPSVNGIIRFGALPPPRILRLRLQLASRLCPIVVANSEAGLKALHISNHRGRVVYNGIDSSRFTDAEPNSKTSSPFRVIMCANMLNSKNHILLAKIAELAFEKFGPRIFSFWSIGDTRDLSILAEVNSIAKRSIDSSMLTLLGKQSEPVSLMAQADLGIHLSNREGLSNSVMEEMACGLPVIASNVGGMNELISSETGILDSSNSPSTLLAGINYFRNNPAIRVKMGKKAQQRIRSFFSIDRMTKDTISIYNEMLERG